MAEAEASTRPTNGTLRQAFREYENDIAFNNARRAAVFAAIFMLAGWSLDLVVFADKAWTFLLIRTLCALLLLGIFLILGSTRHSQSLHAVAQGIALLPLFSICWMIALTDGGNSIYYAGLNIVLVGLSLLLRWSFWNSLGIIVCGFACYALSVAISAVSPDFRTLFGNSYFLFVTSVFVIAGSYFYENLRFSEFCLRTEVERSRELLESQNQQLSALDEAKTRFFANISHELRTPLTIMLGITERLKTVLGRPTPEPGVDEMTTMLEQNGLRLLKLIDDLLDLVRFDTGHADINRQATPITAHLDGLLRSLRHLAEQDRVALLWDCRSDHPSIQLDRDKFDKILLNLVINAIKFTPSGGSIEVKVSVVQNLLRLTVEDTGVGIPPEVLGLDALFSQARRRIFTGADFNRTNFTRFAPQAKLIHLATHFFSDEKDPSRSAFLFSASGGNPALCDTRQILSLQLPAELMILSACETSEKDLLGFRLISGMTAAIRRAGVRDMIASLWPVDELSSQVVPLFYRDYLDGNGSAASLRRSKLALMGRTIGLRDGVRLALAHPFIWANYVLYRFCR